DNTDAAQLFFRIPVVPCPFFRADVWQLPRQKNLRLSAKKNTNYFRDAKRNRPNSLPPRCISPALRSLLRNLPARGRRLPVPGKASGASPSGRKQPAPDTSC